MLKIAKKIFDFIMSLVAFPANLAVLVMYLRDLNDHRSAIHKLNDDLNNLLKLFGDTANHYNRFTESLRNMSNLYNFFKADSEYVRLQLDEILHSMKHGPDKPMDMSK